MGWPLSIPDLAPTAVLCKDFPMVWFRLVPLLLLPFTISFAAEMEIFSPANSTEIDGTPVWQTNETVKFRFRKGEGVAHGVPLYVRVSYLDVGHGRLQIGYRRSDGQWVYPENQMRSSRVGTGEFVDAYFELRDPDILADDKAFLRVRILEPDGTPLSIKSVTVEEEPFDDATFRHILSEPWKKPLNFPPDPSAPKTLKGTIMVGYQGWFRTPNDLANIGWRHWIHPATRDKPVRLGIDMWPDMNDYPRSAWVPAASLKTQSGQPAYLFSSTSPEVVDQHFKWMREYDIDGAFLQRFMSDRIGGDDGRSEWVLYNVRNAANREKRLWAIEYDASGLKNENALEVFKRDWAWLVDELKILDDPYYAREDGRPVVFIWGMSVPSRNFRPEVADEVIEFFKNDQKYGGNYVIGGAPGEWRKLSPEWIDHLKKHDAVLAWQARRFADNKDEFAAMGVKYYPHVWPGFSWSNLKNVTDQYTPRRDGETYWNLITQATAPGNDWLFVGMFDEYDEGTAIMPMSDDPPHPEPGHGRFLTNEGRPSTWWLTLTKYAKEILTGQRPPNEGLPAE